MPPTNYSLPPTTQHLAPCTYLPTSYHPLLANYCLPPTTTTKADQTRGIISSGRVLPSILLSHGVHCRLEQISLDGKWLADETFEFAGQTVTRKAGEKVPAMLMGEWRKLRQAEPGLFARMRVWQQPAATVDSIVWRWQCELEASEFRQLLRVTDCLPAAWAKQFKEASFLLQQLNAPVGPGCTPLQQPTDTHLAKPAKDAGRRKKEQLRELMRLAAVELKQPVEYTSTVREILQVALAMQDEMEALNRRTEVVVQAVRAGGWFAWRPDSEGQLQRADKELWAQVHLKAAGRVSATQLRDRYNWLDSTGKPDRKKAEAWQAEAAEEARPEDHQPEPDADCLDLEMEPGHLGEEDRQAALLALLHPSRLTDADLSAQVQQLGLYRKAKSRQQLEASQKKKGKAASRQRGRLLRKNLAAKFRTALLQAGSPEKRLAQLVPAAGSPGKAGKKPPKQAKKQARQASRKFLGRLAFKKRRQQKKEAKKTEKLLESLAGGAPYLGETGGSLQGQQVRLVEHGLSELLRNSRATVTQHYSTGLCTVETVSGAVRTFSEESLYKLTGSEQPPLPEGTGDLRRCPRQLKLAALEACGGQLEQQVTAATQLGTPELAAAWSELGLRAQLKGDEWPSPRAVAVNPVLLELWVTSWIRSPGSPESHEALEQLQKEVQGVVSQPRAAAVVAFPICAGGHWTLLSLSRQATPDTQEQPNKLVVTYRDTLPGLPSETCKTRARGVLQLAVQVFGEQLAQTVLPERSVSAKQTDGNSCGFFVLAMLEEDYRQCRGEGVRRLPEKFTDKAAHLTKWFRAVLTAKPRRQVDPPPLPPPSEPPGEAAETAVQAEALPLAGVPLSQADSRFGCARCRHSPKGCDQCNPALILRRLTNPKRPRRQ